MIRVRLFLLERLWSVLSVLVAVMQVVILHWLASVLRAGAHASPGFWLVLTALLVASNLAMIPLIAWARARGGAWRRLGRSYMSLAGVTVLLGAAVVGSWCLYWLGAWLFVPVDEARQVFRVASTLAVASVAVVLAWGFSLGQRRVDVSHQRIAISGLHARNAGVRVVQISDLHIGNGLEGGRLERLVARVNDHDADLIVITGDLFDFDPREIPQGARCLASLRARHGVYAVLGNHDFAAGAEVVAAALAEHAPQLRLLRDEVLRLPTPEPLYIAGVDDPGCDWAARDLHLTALERIGSALPSDGPSLLLVHRPEAFAQAARLGFPLVLAGHTHGGQVALPVAGRHWNLSQLISQFDRGLYRRGESILYVSRGLGVAGPSIRLNCSREIATLELHPAE